MISWIGRRGTALITVGNPTKVELAQALVEAFEIGRRDAFELSLRVIGAVLYAYEANDEERAAAYDCEAAVTEALTDGASENLVRVVRLQAAAAMLDGKDADRLFLLAQAYQSQLSPEEQAILEQRIFGGLL